MPGELRKYGTMIAPSLYAPVHQHFFVARMDMAVDSKPSEALAFPRTLEFLGDAASYVSETLCGDEEDESKFAIRVFSSRALLGGNESGESKGDKTDIMICCCGCGGGDDDGERCTGEEGFYKF
ncbi:hypothetical protein HN51_067779 [Arachis hypogaea]